jgi:CRP-like cAMP-binding protein
MRNLWTYLRDIAFFPPDLKEAVEAILTPDPRGKWEFYWQPGRICPYIWYLESGLIRIYEINSGKEATSWIQDRDSIIIAPDSSLDGTTPSNLYIQPLEPCMAWRATVRNVERVMDEHPAFRTHYFRINAEYRRQEHQRQVDLLTLDARQRLRKLLREHPDWASRIPLQILWEYLGMSRNSFFKHRRQSGM